MSEPSRLRNVALWGGIVTVFVVAGSILFHAPRIDLGWRTPRAAIDYRRSIRDAMHAATVTGAIHSVDPGRGIMRIDPSIWEKQGSEMRQSLIRLSSRFFKLEGRSSAVKVLSAYSNRELARYDGAGQFTFYDESGEQLSLAHDAP